MAQRRDGAPQLYINDTPESIGTQIREAGICAQYSLDAPTLTPIAAIGVAVKVVGSTTAGVGIINADLSVDNRITFTGTSPQLVTVTANLYITGIIGSRFAYFFAVNGVPVPSTRMETSNLAAPFTFTVPLQWRGMLSPGDFVEVWTDNPQDTASATVENMNVLARC